MIYKYPIGSTIGRWLVLKHPIRGVERRYLCECLNCNQKRLVAGQSLQRFVNKPWVVCNGCVSCSAKISGLKQRGALHPKNKHCVLPETKDIPGRYIDGLKKGAKKRKLDFLINEKYMQSLLEKQDFKCCISLLPISFDKTATSKERQDKWTASLDRIDNSKGYIEGNVQWVHKDINMMKYTWSQDKLIELCKIIAKANP